MSETKPICDFLSSSEIKKFIIPKYQRNYSWDKSQLDDYWNDLGILLGNNQKHFLGLIVSIKSKDKLEIVDGQQRLATTSILYIAIIDVLSNILEKVEDDKSLTKKIDRKIQDVKKYLFFDTDKLDTARLRPNDNDSAFYNDLIKETEFIIENTGITFEENKSAFDVKTKYLKYLTKSNGEFKWDFRSARHYKMFKAYKFLYFAIEEHVKTEESHIGKLLKIVDILDALKQFHVMSFSTTDDAEAFNLFETLNDRGLSLAAVDLIKNKFIKQCPKDERSEMSDKWDNIFGIDGVLIDENPNLFLRQFYNSRNTPITHSYIYKAYAKKITSIDSANDPESIQKWLKKINIAATDYVTFKKHSSNILGTLLDHNNVLQEILHLLYKTKSVQWHTLAFSLFQRYRASNNKTALIPKINDLFWLIFKLIITYILLDKRFNTIEKKFPNIAKAIYEKKFEDNDEILEDTELFEVTTKKLIKLTPELTLEDIDAELRDNNLAYILCRLCVRSQMKFDIASLDFKNVTLEHIRPQQPNKWTGEVSDPNIVYKIGNMILLKQASNSKVSNKTFVDKKNVYDQIGIYDVVNPKVESLNSETEWNEAIPDRTKKTAELLLCLLKSNEVPLV